MDPIKIVSAEAFKNLSRFKESLSCLSEKERANSNQRSYQVLLNCKTGEMNFPQKISSFEVSHRAERRTTGGGKTENWKPVSLIVVQHSDGGVSFEVNDQHPQVGNLEPLARRISNETLSVLNQFGKEISSSAPQGLAEERVLVRALTSVQRSLEGESAEQLPGWVGRIDRLEAEEILQGKPVGTFLIRKGEDVVQLSADALSRSNREPVQLSVLTFVEQGKKISERLILQTPDGWALYTDDPQLREYTFYPSAQELLKAIQAIASTPITRL